MNNIDPGDASVDVLAILRAELEARTKATVVVESIVLITIDVIALIGNAILCYIIYRNASLHNPTTMFIVSLAFTDLLTATLVMPLTIDAVVHSKRRFSDMVCKAHALAMSVLAQVSIYLMAMTAFNRYVCVVRRSLYKRIFTKKRTLFIIAVVWVVALFINGLPNVLSLDDSYFCPGYLLCWRRMMSPGAIYGFNAWLYGSFTVAYVLIVVCCWKMFRAVSQHNAEVATNLRQGCHHEEVSVSKAVATIVFSFTLCWIPAEVMHTMAKINPFLLPRQLYLVATSLWLLSSAINPFIYGVMNSAFRTEYKKIFSVVAVKRPVRVSSANISTRLDNPETSTPGSSTKDQGL
ncbi:melatonin receptor type 1B-B-like [Montipora foliosa]|uniref:melatonin receptor type 1B-B-like n=1 Tax=Montipora foliosa TaxID=591990 RepID=UPI0035F1EFAE